MSCKTWFASRRKFKCSGEDLYREELIPSKLAKVEASPSEEAKKISVPKLGRAGKDGIKGSFIVKYSQNKNRLQIFRITIKIEKKFFCFM
jgi:hypothetical protein